MTGIGGGVELGAQAARSRALAVLRVRSRALAVALLPAAVAVILLAGGSTGHLVGGGWDAARWAVSVLALLVLAATAAVALVVARARPAVTPTVAVAEESAPDLYRMVRDLADRLDVPAPSAIALTPDCDSWLEDRTHPAHGPPPARDQDDLSDPVGPARRRSAAAPVLVIGSPFLWWMRVGELRAVLAPVVAGTGPAAHPDIAAARRFIRGLDAAVAATSTDGRGPLARAARGGIGGVSRLLLRGCRVHAAEMERGVAAAAAERAQAVDYGLRIVAQEQVGLAYAGWDRLLTRVALPAWRMGRWPSRLDVGVVAALTELSRRDRLAEGFASRLGERPACDLLEEPGLMDEAVSLLAARLFHGGPAETGPDWAPVGWEEYPEEVVDRAWRTDAARLHRVLDTLGVRRAAEGAAPGTDGPTLSRVLDHLTTTPAEAPVPARDPAADADPDATPGTAHHATPGTGTATPDDQATSDPQAATASDPSDPQAATTPDDQATTAPAAPGNADHSDDGNGTEDDDDDLAGTTPRGAALAAGLSAQLAREEARTQALASGTAPPPPGTASGPAATGTALWDDRALPLLPLQPPRTGREILTAHITAMVCCAAMDTAGATPGLDWLDGPTLLVDGARRADLALHVRSLVETGDPAPLRAWLSDLGVRPEKPVRLV
ncbi:MULTISPECIES: hypothetical protein [Streptomyces rochei group]|uniref:hypothetical protein n=1 Tax=Streptomyces rochei group TaxID=2867164 RepID=UPI00187481D5|nr:hypothetical protein [Streptomyces vinaceusdrappus]GHC29255.1 hypothetical protein GCM10010308_53330 [Streptomyces vinaceusdrappus]